MPKLYNHDSWIRLEINRSRRGIKKRRLRRRTYGDNVYRAFRVAFVARTAYGDAIYVGGMAVMHAG